MILEKVKSRVVSYLSYFTCSDNEAVVVDPRKDCQVYGNIAQAAR